MLSQADLDGVHAAALRVLERVGVLVHDDDAVALLRARGARADGRRVFIGQGAVQAALAAAPSAFTLAGRSPARDVHFGDGHTVYGSCSGPAFVLDGDHVRSGSFADLEAMIKLGHVSTVIEFHGDSVELLDLPEERRTPRGMHARLVLSDKAAEWVATNDADLDLAVAAHKILYGAAWHDVPRGLIILNTSSPLQITQETARLLVRWAGLGQATCVTACVMGGTTGPATPAGTLVVQHAEVLATLVLAQAAGEGSPFIYGGLSTMASLRSGAALFGTPEFAQMAEASVRLAHHCGLPVRAGAAVTDAHVPDAQAATESLRGVAGAVRAGSDFVFQAAGILSSFNVLSLEKFVLDEEMLAAVRSLGEPVPAEPDDLAEDVIAAVGPGGSYLSAGHTRAHAREHDRPTFLARDAHERWEAAGGADAREAAAREVERRLEAFVPPDDLDSLVRRQLEDHLLH
ncbi:MAG: trimethylamine methyltransferase family protein [Actinomycetes bacterium]